MGDELREKKRKLEMLQLQARIAELEAEGDQDVVQVEQTTSAAGPSSSAAGPSALDALSTAAAAVSAVSKKKRSKTNTLTSMWKNKEVSAVERQCGRLHAPRTPPHNCCAAGILAAHA